MLRNLGTGMGFCEYTGLPLAYEKFRRWFNVIALIYISTISLKSLCNQLLENTQVQLLPQRLHEDFADQFVVFHLTDHMCLGMMVLAFRFRQQVKAFLSKRSYFELYLL